MSNNSENLEELISRVRHYKYSDFKEINPIGNGSFGCVYRATWKDSRYVALKTFKNEQTLKEIVKEV